MRTTAADKSALQLKRKSDRAVSVQDMAHKDRAEARCYFFLLFTPKEIILIYICKYKEDTVYLHKRVTVMVTLTNYTREEFIDIFKKAKTRKAEWQKQAERELREMSERIANNKARVKSR